MTIEQIKQAVISVIRDSTETEISLTEDTHLIQDMGLSSVETMLLLSDLEDRFYITIPASLLRNVQTVGDLCRLVIDCLAKS